MREEGKSFVPVWDDFLFLTYATCRTVELISYTVKGLRPVPLIEKAAPESGELCGSVFLNRIFAKYLKDRLENNANWSDDIMVKAMEHFEVNIKKRFRGRANETFFVPVSPIAESRRLGINSRGEFRLSGDDLRNIFEPVINETVRLVMDQIRATEKEVKAVFLVGGFGENVYLRERLRTEIGENIEVKKAIDRYAPDLCVKILHMLTDDAKAGRRYRRVP